MSTPTLPGSPILNSQIQVYKSSDGKLRIGSLGKQDGDLIGFLELSLQTVLEIGAVSTNAAQFGSSIAVKGDASDTVGDGAITVLKNENTGDEPHNYSVLTQLGADGSMDVWIYNSTLDSWGTGPRFSILKTGEVKFTNAAEIKSLDPSLTLNNNTPTTGKNWAIASYHDGKLYFGQKDVITPLVLSPETGEANFVQNVIANGSFTQPTSTINVSVGGHACRISFLSESNASEGYPLVVYFHGDGEDQNSCFTVPVEKKLTDRLIAGGCMVASSNAGGSLWGNQVAQDAYYDLLQHCIATYNITKVIFIGQSMGGMTSLNLLASGRVPEVNSWYGIYPATNLRYAYFNEGFVGRIETAYGFSGGANFDAATAGFDPNDATSDDYAPFRMRMTASYGDTVISRANNSDLLYAKVNGISVEAEVITATGDHGDDSAFIPNDILNYLKRNYIRDRSNKAIFLGSVMGRGRKTNTPNTTGNDNDFVGGMAFWSFRTDLLNALNIDVYNGGSPISALKVSQDGGIKAIKLNITTTTDYADNAAALAGGLVAGDVYRTGDLLKVVH